ncbi:uncharacterized protein METZ01_LOCUS380165, partial [marine metagenome]
VMIKGGVKPRMLPFCMVRVISFCFRHASETLRPTYQSVSKRYFIVLSATNSNTPIKPTSCTSPTSG